MPLTEIRIGSRASRLARAQVAEITHEIRRHHPLLHLLPTWVQTTGDLDQSTSLRSLGKTDFFTREIDMLVLDRICDVGVHSAKDLPESLPDGLSLIALTSGLDPSDALVFRAGETLATLRPGASIATSSVRRENVVRSLRADLHFIDLRGTIEQRLAKLTDGEADGVVIATAALIRLQLIHLPHLVLPGETVPGQGQLAVVARSDNGAMRQLFRPLDSR